MKESDAVDAETFSSTHHTWVIGPWADSGGVQVAQHDMPEFPVALLRNREEVAKFVTTLLLVSGRS